MIADELIFTFSFLCGSGLCVLSTVTVLFTLYPPRSVINEIFFLSISPFSILIYLLASFVFFLILLSFSRLILSLLYISVSSLSVMYVVFCAGVVSFVMFFSAVFVCLLYT